MSHNAIFTVVLKPMPGGGSNISYMYLVQFVNSPQKNYIKLQLFSITKKVIFCYLKKKHKTKKSNNKRHQFTSMTDFGASSHM